MFAEHRLAVIVFPTQPMPAPLIESARQGARDKAATEEAAMDEAPSQVRAAWDAGAEPATQAGQPGQFGRQPVSQFRNTHVTGVLGVPGLSIPAGLTAHGLPVGLEFDALAGYDSELLALGIAVEQAWPKIPAPQPIA
jgi:Asp-tRNA(Asn)/Glu-tRNA(Gln) amidotransferase A subunit family amidase